MTEIGFYHLTTPQPDKSLIRLLEKIYDSSSKALVLVSSERLEHLDTLLWTSSAFLPHGSKNQESPDQTPIWLTDKSENPNGANVLVSIDGIVPDETFQNAFEKHCLLFDGANEAQKEGARKYWKKCQQESKNVTYWQQGDDGSWQKKQ